MSLYDDGDFYEVSREAKQQILQGNIVFQKWTCSFCDERITMTTPNIFYTKGKHEDCKIDANSDTDLTQRGCNYLLVRSKTPLNKLFDLRKSQ